MKKTWDIESVEGGNECLNERERERNGLGYSSNMIKEET